MAAMPPALHDLYLAKGKVHIIMDHNDILHTDLKIGSKLLDRDTASVHIRKGLDQKDILEPHTRTDISGIELFFGHTAPGPLSQSIDNIKANIMPGPGILIARISQTR